MKKEVEITATNQEVTRATGNQQKLGKAKEALFPSAGSTTLLTPLFWTSGF
jgi:hypothetical protein